MRGTLEGQSQINEPLAWTNKINGSRIFYTSLGSVGDFKLPAFQRILLNGILWTIDKPIPPDDPRVIAKQ